MMEPIVKTVRVECSPERAFEVFTAEIGRWWPADKYSLTGKTGVSSPTVLMEPFAGGRLQEVEDNGTVHQWGFVRLYQPHSALSIAWQLSGTDCEPTIIDVTFEADGDGTRVCLSHHNWQALGDRAVEVREKHFNGWEDVFVQGYYRLCAGLPA